MPRVQSVDDSVFAAVNVYDPEGGQQHVEIYVRVEQGPEGAQMGLAIDGSNSMKEAYGAHLPPFLKTPEANTVQLVVKPLNTFLRGFSADGKTHIIYWAVGNGGAELEPIGVFDETADASLAIEGPKGKAWGGGTKLAPAVQYFAKEFAAAKWALVLFITDGEIEDMDDVKRVCMQLGQEMSSSQRGYVKLVMVGVGRLVNESQMDELNDMFEGSGLNDPNGESIDMWDARLVSEMGSLWDVLGEVDFGIELPVSTKIYDDKGKEVLSYADGTPMKLSFQVPVGTPKVTVVIAGNSYEQKLA